MHIIKKLFAFFVCAAVLVGASVCIGAAGGGELSITAKNVNSGELEIKLQNVSDYYLGCVNIKVSPVSGSGAKVNSFGIGCASGDDSVYSVELGGTVSVYAKVSSTNKGNSQTTTNATTTKKPSQSGTTQKNPAKTDPSQAVPEPAETDVSDIDTVTGTADETSGTKDTSGKKTESEGTTVGSVHSIAPGESETIVANISGDSADEDGSDTNDEGQQSDDPTSPLVWIISCAAAVVIAVVVAVIVIKRKKNITKDISAVIVFALILGAVLSSYSGANTVYAADGITVPTEGSVSTTVELSGGKGSVTVTAEP